MLVENVQSMDTLNQRLKENSVIIVNFQNSTCDICRLRSKKLSNIISKLNYGFFKDLVTLKVDTANSHFEHFNYNLHICTHPTIIIFIDQKERFRFHSIRNFEYELKNQLNEE
jgi:thiol-disulfide isomerase/thioredoxin